MLNHRFTRHWLVVSAVLLASACTGSGTADEASTTLPETLVEMVQSDMDAHSADVENQAWIVGEAMIAPGSDIRVRATRCPTPKLLVSDLVRDNTYAGKFFEPLEDTADTRDLVMRVPAEFRPGQYEISLTCYVDHDVALRVRELSIEIVGPTVSATAIDDVDPAVQPTFYAPPGEGLRMLQPPPPGFPFGDS